MSKKVLIIMDPIESINVEKDTTYQLMLSAQNIGHKLYYLIPGTLAIRSLQPVGMAARIKITRDKTPFYNLSDKLDYMLSDFDYILMRQDPPVDNNYIYKTYILDLIKNYETKVINTGYSLRNYNEKLIILNFPEHIPDTIVTSDKKNLENFKKNHKKIILKPLNLMGGRSIYFIENIDKNLNVIFEDMTNLGNNYIIAQEYLEDVNKGDKRIIVINGKVIKESVIRVSNNEDHRSNIASGGSIEKYILNKEEIKICENVAKFLKAKNIFFAGIDMIGNKITEINITSPTCLAEINKFHNKDIGKFFWEQLK
ncbi:glutathione synthase [Gammaproteobacteria bacterium]|nr:glutathione synthase [Gammaproteobacteria bacterium]